MANAHDLLMAQRAAMMGGKPLPYLRRVAYLEFPNTAWIDTCITFSDGVKLSTRETFVNSGSRQLQGSNTSRQYYGVTAGGLIEFGALMVNATNVQVDGETEYGIVYHVLNGSNICQVYLGEEKIFEKSGAYNLLSTSWKFGLITGYSSRMATGYRNHGFKFENASGVLLSCIPVLDLSARPCFYNEAPSAVPADDPSRFFYNESGVGEFTPGPNVT